MRLNDIAQQYIYAIKSIAMVFVILLTTSICATHSMALPTEHYAQHSVLSSGKWYKIAVTNSGIHQIRVGDLTILPRCASMATVVRYSPRCIAIAILTTCLKYPSCTATTAYFSMHKVLSSGCMTRSKSAYSTSKTPILQPVITLLPKTVPKPALPTKPPSTLIP